MEVEDIQKEIQSLKRRTLYLSTALAVSSIIMFSTTVNLCTRCTTIQDYYFQSLDHERQLLLELEKQNLNDEQRLQKIEQYLLVQKDQNEEIEQILSKLQQFRYEINAMHK